MIVKGLSLLVVCGLKVYLVFYLTHISHRTGVCAAPDIGLFSSVDSHQR